ALDPFFRYDLARSIVRGVGAYLYPEPGDFVMPPRPIRRWAALPSSSGDWMMEYDECYSTSIPRLGPGATVVWEANRNADEAADQSPDFVSIEMSTDGAHYREAGSGLILEKCEQLEVEGSEGARRLWRWVTPL